jgi:hypothetical protein
LIEIRKKPNKYQTFGAIPKSKPDFWNNSKIKNQNSRKRQNRCPNTQIHDHRSLYWLGTGTLLKMAGLN